jgi:hypothetical protein
VVARFARQFLVLFLGKVTLKINVKRILADLALLLLNKSIVIIDRIVVGCFLFQVRLIKIVVHQLVDVFRGQRTDSKSVLGS